MNSKVIRPNLEFDVLPEDSRLRATILKNKNRRMIEANVGARLVRNTSLALFAAGSIGLSAMGLREVVTPYEIATGFEIILCEAIRMATAKTALNQSVELTTLYVDNDLKPPDWITDRRFDLEDGLAGESIWRNINNVLRELK